MICRGKQQRNTKQHTEDNFTAKYVYTSTTIPKLHVLE